MSLHCRLRSLAMLAAMVSFLDLPAAAERIADKPPRQALHVDPAPIKTDSSVKYD